LKFRTELSAAAAILDNEASFFEHMTLPVDISAEGDFVKT
jgi:hypothetical protein